jgi:hypothetical protein
MISRQRRRFRVVLKDSTQIAIKYFAQDRACYVHEITIKYRL